MQFKQVALESIAYILPDRVWTSKLIEEKLAPLYQRLNLLEGRLEMMTGIRERRFWSSSITPSKASALAGEKVLKATKIAREKIDLLIHCGVCRDRLEPATASYVHKKLSLPNHTQFLDISNACLGFLNAIVLAAGLIESGQIKNALLVSGENGKPLIENTVSTLLDNPLNRQEIKPYFANLTIGSGAVAAILSHSDQVPSDVPRVGYAKVLSNSTVSNLCQGDTVGDNGLLMQTDSEALLEAGIALAKENWRSFLEETGWAPDTPNRVLTHQVGIAHQKRLFEALKINPEKDYVTYPFLGNIGSVSLPLTLAHAMENEVIQPDDLVALLGIGSGLSSIMISIC